MKVTIKKRQKKVVFMLALHVTRITVVDEDDL
jgi:hypothetical protein